jgi:short-subunit dehydrogenase
MKVIITGHTKGIGKCLYEKFTRHGHEVIGYSRSTGHDIEDLSVRNQIIQASSDADMFINNAYSTTGQTSLLKDFIGNWTGTNKRIVNISSKLSFFPIGKEADLDEYIVQKANQNSLIQERMFSGTPQILNVIIGLVDTDMSTRFKGTKISPEKIAILIYDLSSQAEIQVQQIVVDVPGLDWKNIQRS